MFGDNFEMKFSSIPTHLFLNIDRYTDLPCVYINCIVSVKLYSDNMQSFIINAL